MRATIVIGETVQGIDGTLGWIRRIILNPNTGALEYLIVQAGDDTQREYYVPRSRIELGPDSITLGISAAELGSLPAVEDKTAVQGSLRSNLHDLCVVDQTTPVKTQDGVSVGRFHGLVIDAGYQLEQILLNGGAEAGVTVARIARYSEETLFIELVERAVAGR